MDKLQRTFTTAYVTKLKNAVKDGSSINDYTNDTFNFDQSQIRFVANIYTPEGLLEEMLSAENDFKAAVKLFEAYKDLPLVVASNENFWVYLTHTELFEYCKKKYPVNADKVKNKKSHILDRWFFENGYNRNTLAALWWGVKVSIDEDNKDNPYHLTEIFFKNYSFRVTWLTKMLRTKDGLLGILDFLERNPQIYENSFENRGQFIAKYFNRLGGSKQLSFLPRDFFSNELEKIKDSILAVKSRKDVTNMDASQIMQRSKSDHTKYSLNGSAPLSKGRLAVEIVRAFIQKHPNYSFEAIKERFPNSLIPSTYRSKGLIVSAKDIKNSSLTPEYQNKRYFYDKKECWLKSADGIDFLVNNQWDISSIGNIISVAEEEGFSVSIFTSSNTTKPNMINIQNDLKEWLINYITDFIHDIKDDNEKFQHWAQTFEREEAEFLVNMEFIVDWGYEERKEITEEEAIESAQPYIERILENWYV